ncbi:hypothetical protein Sjap_015450 [Stephania japonica]|uniref:Uncharacterized protein n=1 Tax=Stephania japonica TaxID=461633 RepID=A0AAP0IJ97_9MAGN
MADEEDDAANVCRLQLEVNRSRKKMMVVADSADGGRRMCSRWMKKMMADSSGVAELGRWKQLTLKSRMDEEDDDEEEVAAERRTEE